MQFFENLVDPAAHGLVTAVVLLVVYGGAMCVVAWGPLRKKTGLMVASSSLPCVMFFVAYFIATTPFEPRYHSIFAVLGLVCFGLETVCIVAAARLFFLRRRLRDWFYAPLVVTLAVIVLVVNTVQTILHNAATTLEGDKGWSWFSLLMLAAVIPMTAVAGDVWRRVLCQRMSRPLWWYLQWLGPWAPVPPITTTDDAEHQRDV